MSTGRSGDSSDGVSPSTAGDRSAGTSGNKRSAAGSVVNPLQQVWDSAARLAMRGVALPVIVSAAVDAAGPQIDRDVLQSVPRRGRTFWWSMAKSLAWGVASLVSLLVIGSFGARPVPVLKLSLCLLVVIWAVAFGTMAANQKVRNARIRAATTQRAKIGQLAQDAARHVWAAEVDDAWKPWGPAVSGVPTATNQVPTEWLRRFGLTADQATAVLTDGTTAGLGRAISISRGRPVVLFLAEPAGYSDDARTLADDRGIALFVAGRNGLHSMSAVASSALKAYQDRVGPAGPADALLAGWATAAAPGTLRH